MTDFNEILKQARQMQEKMQNAQKEAAKLVLVGESGAGLVRVHMNGHHDVQRVELDSGLLSEDKDVIEVRPEFYLFGQQEFADTVDSTWGTQAVGATRSCRPRTRHHQP